MAITLTAGTFSGVLFGYARSGNSFGAAPFGAISAEPVAGKTLDLLVTGSGADQLVLVGDTTATSITSLTVNGSAWTVSAPSYDSNSNTTNYPISGMGAGFAEGQAYTVDVATSGGGAPSVSPANSSHAHASTQPSIAGPAYAGPTWVAVTPAVGGTAGVSVDFSSTGRQAGDQLYVAVATANQAVVTPGGLTPTVQSPQSRGTAATAGAIRLTLYEKVSTGTETTIAIADPGDHVYAVGIVLRGAGGAAIAVDASAGNNVAAATSVSFGGVTTNDLHRLIMHVVATDRDSAGPSFSGQANADVPGITERFDAGTTSGLGSGIAVYTGEKILSGATANTTATQAASSAYVWITLALKNASIVAAPASSSHAHSSTGPTLGTNVGVAPSSSSHAHASTSPAVSVPTGISPADASHGHSSTSPSITAAAAISPSASTHAHSSTAPAIAARAAVAPDDAQHGHSATTSTIAALFAITVQDAAVTHSASTPTLSAIAPVSPASASHESSATSPTIQPATPGMVSPQNSGHAHTAEPPMLSASIFVLVHSTTHATSSTSPTTGAIITPVNVYPGGTTHTHAATSPGIASSPAISPDSAAHQISSTAPAIAFGAGISPASAIHALETTSPIIGSVAAIAVDDSFIGHIATSATISSHADELIIHYALVARPDVRDIVAIARATDITATPAPSTALRARPD